MHILVYLLRKLYLLNMVPHKQKKKKEKKKKNEKRKENLLFF